MGMAGGMAGVMGDTPSIGRSFWGNLSGGRSRRWHAKPGASTRAGRRLTTGLPAKDASKPDRGGKPPLLLSREVAGVVGATVRCFGVVLMGVGGKDRSVPDGGPCRQRRPAVASGVVERDGACRAGRCRGLR